MIVDEASMIDADLMLELLETVPDGASLIFIIGDVDQLLQLGLVNHLKILLNQKLQV